MANSYFFLIRYQSVENQAVKEYLIDQLIPAVDGAHSPRKIKSKVIFLIVFNLEQIADLY